MLAISLNFYNAGGFPQQQTRCGKRKLTQSDRSNSPDRNPILAKYFKRGTARTEVRAEC
ncbi:MAG: hypothetical protein F6K28_41600, partial [Microcoleus sp. SIO2G3]|nr:hypothetical protein [Microcoleus sp. SIO2G3]